MAYGQTARGGHGCVVGALVLVALVLAALCVALYWGVIDRWLYERQVQATGEALYAQIEDSHGKSPSDFRYAYTQLDAGDRQKYAVLLDAFQSREARDYPESDMDDLARIRDCVIADYPELFYISGVQKQTETNRSSGVVTGVKVEGKYAYSVEETQQLQAQLDAAVDECFSQAPFEIGTADDYEIAKYLFEYLVAHVEYDHEAAGVEEGSLTSAGQTVIDALVNKRAVCAGYAHAYQYLLNRVGIPCAYITGDANGGTHAWCAARLDGEWYLIDPTWGDPQFLDEDGSSYDAGRIDYDYFCVTTRDMGPSHVPTAPYAVPPCTSMADNYYVREGCYLESPSVDDAGAIIEAAADRGEEVARFRCSDRESYDQVVEGLFDGQQVYRFIPGNSCRYSLNDNILSVEVRF